MKKEIISTDDAPAAIGPYSQALVAGQWVFVSGQIGLDPKTGELAGPGFPTQARQTLQNVGAILDSAGCSRSDVVSVDVYLSDLSNYPLFNEIYQRFFGDHRPARVVVGVDSLPKGSFIEVRCIACRNTE